MSNVEAILEEVWGELFSGDAARVRKVWGSLTDEECGIVLQHLQKMLDDPGFQPAQKESATTALRLIREIDQ
jgi:hypothetical protein